MSSKSGIRSFFKATLIYGVIGGARTLTEIFLLPIYAGYLTPAEFGVLDILILMIMIGGFAAMLEIGNAVFRFYFENESEKYRKSVISTATLTMLFNGLLVFSILYLAAGRLSSAILGSPSYSYLFSMSGLFIFINALIAIPANLLRMKDKPVQYTVISAGQIALSVIGIVIFVIFMKLGVAGIIWARILAASSTLTLCLFLARKDLGFVFDSRLLGKMLRYSLPLIPAGIAIWGINGINRIFMIHFLTLEQLGFYSMAAKFAAVITLSVIAFQLAWPHFALSNMNVGGSSATFARIFNFVAAAGIWLVITATLLAETVIRFFLNPVYLPAAGAVLPLALGMFMYSLFYFFSTGSVFSKKTTQVLPPIGIALIFNIICNLTITPAYGFKGTAWVTTGSYFVMATVMLYLTRKYKYADFHFWKLARLAGLALPAVVISGWLANFGDNQIWPRILIIVLFPLLIYSAGILKKSETSFEADEPLVSDYKERKIEKCVGSGIDIN